MFKKLSFVLVAGREDQALPQFVRNEILHYLTTLENEFGPSLPKFNDLDLMQHSLKLSVENFLMTVKMNS